MAVIEPPWRHAVVTGASSGIGEAVAMELAVLGVGLTLVARRAAKLEQLAHRLRGKGAPFVDVVVADLLTEEGLAAVEAVLTAEEPPVDLLVNNAGVGTAGPFGDLPLGPELDEVALNVTTVVRLTHTAVGAMRVRGRGAIMNVSSLASYQPAPASATYAATKAFVTSFSESLHEELRGSGVTVTAVLPGFTRTEFHLHLDPAVSAKVPRPLWMTARTVAISAVADTAAGRALSVPGWTYKVLTFLITPLPRNARRWLAGRASRR